MRHISIDTAEHVTVEMLRDFVLAQPGGTWRDDGIAGENGYIYRGSTWMSIIGDTKLNQFYDENDIQVITEALGSAPQSTIELTHGAGSGNGELADDIAQQIILKWHGVLSDKLL